jgi:hemin uptake protein HemP
MGIVTEHPQRSLQKSARKPEETTHTTGTGKSGEVDSKQLFADGNELFIRHDGERYTLRRTSKGKLILTK